MAFKAYSMLIVHADARSARSSHYGASLDGSSADPRLTEQRLEEEFRAKYLELESKYSAAMMQVKKTLLYVQIPQHVGNFTRQGNITRKKAAKCPNQQKASALTVNSPIPGLSLFC